MLGDFGRESGRRQRGASSERFLPRVVCICSCLALAPLGSPPASDSCIATPCHPWFCWVRIWLWSSTERCKPSASCIPPCGCIVPARGCALASACAAPGCGACAYAGCGICDCGTISVRAARTKRRPASAGASGRPTFTLAPRRAGRYPRACSHISSGADGLRRVGATVLLGRGFVGLAGVAGLGFGAMSWGRGMPSAGGVGWLPLRMHTVRLLRRGAGEVLPDLRFHVAAGGGLAHAMNGRGGLQQLLRLQLRHNARQRNMIRMLGDCGVWGASPLKTAPRLAWPRCHAWPCRRALS